MVLEINAYATHCSGPVSFPGQSSWKTLSKTVTIDGSSKNKQLAFLPFFFFFRNKTKKHILKYYEFNFLLGSLGRDLHVFAMQTLKNAAVKYSIQNAVNHYFHRKMCLFTI